MQIYDLRLQVTWLLLETVAKKDFAQLWMVCQLQCYLEGKNLGTVLHALITTPLDYCSVLHMRLL